MSDDEADPELLELLRQSLGISRKSEDEISPDTGVLRDAEFIYNNAIDVSIDMYGTHAAAVSLYNAMQKRSYSTQSWYQHELHPAVDGKFSDVDLVNFIFTMDLLNFSFWSDKSEVDRFQVEYQGKQWTGYNSLVACLRRALDEKIPITNPRLWNHQACTDQLLEWVFRSATDEPIPMLRERISMLRESGQILLEIFGDSDVDTESSERSPAEPTDEANESNDIDGPGKVDGTREHLRPSLVGDGGGAANETVIDEHINADHKSNGNELNDGTSVLCPQANPSAALKEANGSAPETHISDAQDQLTTVVQQAAAVHLPIDTSVVRMIEMADHSAGKLVNLLAKHFPAFQDETRFDGKRVRLLKRAQILVADLWAAFQGISHGDFDDVEHLTMFADYRVPQILQAMGVLIYSPPLQNRIRTQQSLVPGHSWEVQLRGCSIWAVELIRREIVKRHPDAAINKGVNAVLLDFLLYDLAKEREADDDGQAQDRAKAEAKTQKVKAEAKRRDGAA